jgi:hypothetical protein
LRPFRMGTHNKSSDSSERAILAVCTIVSGSDIKAINVSLRHNISHIIKTKSRPPQCLHNLVSSYPVLASQAQH